EDYLAIKDYLISKGRGLQYSDIAQRAKVCVVGAYVDQAYYGGNAVGQTLRVGGQSLTILGVVEQQSDELEERGADDFLYLPYSTASRLSGRVSNFVITVKSEDTLAESKQALEKALYAFFASDDFYTVTSMSEMLETMTGMKLASANLWGPRSGISCSSLSLRRR
ncbi:MAG: ABC transporter permease, partial [Lawsonibacter sp.]